MGILPVGDGSIAVASYAGKSYVTSTVYYAQGVLKCQLALKMNKEINGDPREIL